MEDVMQLVPQQVGEVRQQMEQRFLEFRAAHAEEMAAVQAQILQLQQQLQHLQQQQPIINAAAAHAAAAAVAPEAAAAAAAVQAVALDEHLEGQFFVRLPRLGTPALGGAHPPVEVFALNAWMYAVSTICQGMVLLQAWRRWVEALDGRYQVALYNNSLGVIGELPGEVQSLAHLRVHMTKCLGIPVESARQRDLRIRSKVIFKAGMTAKGYVELFEREVNSTPCSMEPFPEAHKVALFLDGLDHWGPTRMLMALKNAELRDIDMSTLRRNLVEWEPIFNQGLSGESRALDRSHDHQSAVAVPQSSVAPMDVYAIRSAERVQCFGCGRYGHYARDCRRQHRDK